ncbi:aminopeptidase P family N-terminal domain-containing protein [Paenibacillus alkaliterrae]|uniref:aminopeptidase P family N-terminal domain-containing protein n=1 Tax=Paenibacillus alkaliterrae TaxID=320909 RepID=UPI001F36669D|nr:aminopeptidase P family N-terminal domain-containing protein [Paenibacillus alkaliterrae]MCF2940854.1 aminopeptidase P family N-terminal domain-containing protein [Paenibacillus alkaliterrae]
MEALRLKRVREQLDGCGLDALFITNAFNRRYLTGFTGSAGYVLITKEKALLFTDFRYSSQAAEQAKAYEIVQHAIKPAESILEAIQSLLEHDVVHYCVTNMPGSVPRTSTTSLTYAAAPYALQLASRPWEQIVEEGGALAAGLNIAEGRIMHPLIIQAYTETASVTTPIL